MPTWSATKGESTSSPRRRRGHGGSVQIRNRATWSGTSATRRLRRHGPPSSSTGQRSTSRALGVRAGCRLRVPRRSGRTRWRAGAGHVDRPARRAARPSGGVCQGDRRRGLIWPRSTSRAWSTPGRTQFAYGAVGPRAFLVADESGVLATRRSGGSQGARPPRPARHASPISDVRASREYREAMLRS